MASRLDKVGWPNAVFWLRLLTCYDLTQARLNKRTRSPWLPTKLASQDPDGRITIRVCSGTKQLASQVPGLAKDNDLYRELSAAALLHDIGHGPFSHLSEDTYSLRPSLFDGLIYTTGTDRHPPFPAAQP